VTDRGQQHVLVVGGAGFVGANLVRALAERGCERILVVDNLLSSERDNLPDHPAVELVEGSITDDRILAELPDRLDAVYHLATYHGNQSSMADPLADHEHNLLSTLKLFERIRDLPRLRKVVYASAGCTVAEKTFEGASATEEDAPVSLWHDTPYQISKIAGELYGNFYFLRHGLPVVKARFQNVYGPGEVLGAGRWRGTVHTIWRNVTPTFVYKALHGDALSVDNGGVATRDFIYVDDIVRGLIACEERGTPGEVYNLASGVETPIRELAELVNEVAGNPTPIEVAPPRDWDRSGQRFGSTAKAQAELGFAAETALRPGLERTVAWTRDNLDLIERCIARHAERVAGLEGAAA
jgi:nucleoside-diphosphate-sugar epimerase